ncbi:methyltransferase [Raphidocelis subcapitata]|uniref:Methyltransferase n=1 Tax=Raphidocelis subcapitata TaxID=307507 RepID=A0A2V0P2B3_9CHLO|nr:methyltransferase [Raphidocelis subcapitata]|eukprot:GBF91973.1 methyltransferase [Raphidocelis subcapitata]
MALWQRWQGVQRALRRARLAAPPAGEALLHDEGAAHAAERAARQQAAEVARELGAAPGGGMEVFDRALKRAHRDRAAALRGAAGGADPLLASVSDRLLDRLEDCVAKFPTAVVLGGAGEYIAERLAGGRGGIERVIHIDSSPGMIELAKARRAALMSSDPSKPWPEVSYVLADEEALPLAPGSVDVIISCLGLHWANDLPGAMAQCRLALRPDGLFLAAMFGGDTLQELRIACAVAQQERQGGVSPFVSPLAQVRDAGNLLTRASLALPTVDVDNFSINYATPFDLVAHLRSMGEGAALAARRRGALTRGLAVAAAAAYGGLFPGEGGEGVAATYQVMYMTGWSPDKSQPRPAKRGSANITFEEFAAQLESHGAAGPAGAAAAAAAGGGAGERGPEGSGAV